jgi:hypothetical protein
MGAVAIPQAVHDYPKIVDSKPLSYRVPTAHAVQEP